MSLICYFLGVGLMFADLNGSTFSRRAKAITVALALGTFFLWGFLRELKWQREDRDANDRRDKENG